MTTQSYEKRCYGSIMVLVENDVKNVKRLKKSFKYDQYIPRNCQISRLYRWTTKQPIYYKGIKCDKDIENLFHTKHEPIISLTQIKTS